MSLPEPYARALRLVADGATDDQVAAALDIELAAVPALLEIARSKAGHTPPPTPS